MSGEVVQIIRIRYPKISSLKLKYVAFCLLSIISLVSFTKKGVELSLVYYLKYASMFIYFGIIIVERFRKNMSLEGKKIILLTLGFLIMLFSSLFSNNNSFSSTFLLTLLTTLLLALSLLVFPEMNKIDKEMYYKILYVVLISMVVIPCFVLSFDSSSFYLMNDRIRFVAFFNNANEVARFLSVSFILSFYYSHNLLKKNYSIINLVLSLISIYLIYLTNSRASLYLCIMFVVSYYIYTTVKKKGVVVVTLVLLLLGGILLGIVLLDNNFLSLDFSYKGINELTSNRLEIWVDRITALDSSEILFGIGSVREGLKATTVLTSGYIEILLYYGIFGLLYWITYILYLLWSKVKQLRQLERGDVIGLSFLLALLVYYFFEGGLLSIGNIVSLMFWMEISYNDNISEV